MYQDVLADNTRELVLYDDGRHDDYNANDGIFGNTFHETDVNGAYFVRAAVSGERAGQPVSRNLLASFQVGPISQNEVTSSQTLAYMRRAAAVSATGSAMYYAPGAVPQQLPGWGSAEDRLPTQAVYDIDDLQTSDPLDGLDGLQQGGGFDGGFQGGGLEGLDGIQGSDPMDALNEMLR
jgi:hypothetical protein